LSVIDIDNVCLASEVRKGSENQDFYAWRQSPCLQPGSNPAKGISLGQQKLVILLNGFEAAYAWAFGIKNYTKETAKASAFLLGLSG
jgi:hypothetical protein